jgi:3-methyladenine DNA glycosylase Mpg
VGLAFGLDRTSTGLDLCDPGSPLRIEIAPGDTQAPRVVTTPRIGVASAGEPWAGLPWRFLVPDSPSLSRRR